MNWTACLFIINFIFHLVISCRKDYFFDTGSILIEHRESIDGYKAVDEDGKSALIDWKDNNLADKLAKKMFRKQMRVYLWFQFALVICNVAIQLWGRIFVHKSHFLACNDGGKTWLYTTIQGELFVGAHMVLIITQAVMLEQALYKVPKKLGWFQNTEESLLLADNFEQPKKKADKWSPEHSNEEDNYKAVNN